MKFHWVIDDLNRNEQSVQTRSFRFDDNIRGLVLNGKRPDYVTITEREVERFSRDDRQRIITEIRTRLAEPRNVFVEL